MNKLMSVLAAAATLVTVPAVSAIPASANAAVRVVVAAPGVGFYYGGRHYHHRKWRNGAWAYYAPYAVGPGYGYGYGYAPAYGYAPTYGYAPAYGYRNAPRYHGGRYPHRARCSYGHHGRVCR
jgi:hypothetical protein